jgi:hypothetical protein
MEVSGQLHGPATLPKGKEPQVSIRQETVLTQSWSECYGEEKNLFPPARSQTPIP